LVPKRSPGGLSSRLFHEKEKSCSSNQKLCKFREYGSLGAAGPLCPHRTTGQSLSQSRPRGSGTS
jgi:hypothetical protein